MALIELEDVSKLYGFGDATTLALDEVSLTIERGEFVAVMGPSGCGKSTLMNLIGLLDRPSHGNYRLDGKAVARLRTRQAAKIRRDTIGFIFQSFNLLPRLTALENVALPLAYKGIPLSRRRKLASQMLERVGVQSREYFLPSQLSGGQAQCAAIARALVNNPKIIIADEPTGNLDSDSSRLVMELLADIHKTGNTVLFVTHNPELTRYATRVVYMHDGTIIHDEKTALGRVASTARKVLYTLPVTSEEDDLAGVSVLMKALPDKTAARPKRKKPANKSRRSKLSKTPPRGRTTR
ncbi:MAG TPA: ABC transporter ATP-binding protein [Verrucomicrobiae bacterium]|jgi:putative ABC transport system ATP-binding protein|nr:ABC transporter ATP-binding protein [Verrucomicrobiae bacterium]